MLMNAFLVVGLSAVVAFGVIAMIRFPSMFKEWFRSGKIKIKLYYGELGHVYRATHPKLFLAAVALHCISLFVLVLLTASIIFLLYGVLTEGFPPSQ
jgi:multisubunit Na+/H+ antiporter MnhG subunit